MILIINLNSNLKNQIRIKNLKLIKLNENFKNCLMKLKLESS